MIRERCSTSIWSSPLAVIIPISAQEAMGRVVAAGRMLAGLDQAALATAAGVSAATVSNVERGNDARPTTLSAIRRALRHAGVNVCFSANNGHASAAICFEEPHASEDDE